MIFFKDSEIYRRQNDVKRNAFPSLYICHRFMRAFPPLDYFIVENDPAHPMMLVGPPGTRNRFEKGTDKKDGLMLPPLSFEPTLRAILEE
ncbi:MAG: hypothetical protein PW843_20045 [Azospirillaceae bacterium]|nr:hypothetical protein [Azospirillaceae bacterium]